MCLSEEELVEVVGYCPVRALVKRSACFEIGKDEEWREVLHFEQIARNIAKRVNV